MTANTTGSNNTAVGQLSLSNNTYGSYNTSVGIGTGVMINAGQQNTFIGALADATGDFNNAMAIGYDAKVNGSNKIRIGNSSVSVIEGQVAWSNPSDKRLKENIIYTNRLGLDFIKKLQTVSYNYIADNTKTRYDGFIAQDIEKVMNDLGVPFSALKKSDDGTLSLAYSDFVMPLVNAVKEQNKLIESLENQLINQKEEIIALRKIIEKLQEKYSK